MDFSERDSSTNRRATGLTIAVVVHIAIAYALVSGLARKVVEVIKQPLETKIIEEVKPPPPKPPPPLPPPPKMTAPPPPFVPPPEIQIATPPPPNVISAVTSKPPPPAPFVPAPPAPLAPPAPKAAPAPPAPPPSYPASIDSKTCSNSDEFYPRQSRQLNETGTVVLRFVVEANGTLSSVDVEKSSGYRRLDQAARKLLETCKFKPGMVNGKLEKSSATLEVVWKLD
ncbi:MAG: energy transducer TonB [Betaproteobacteria bacterium]